MTYLDDIPNTDDLCDWAETANFDGFPMPKLSVPYQFVRCPCGRPAVVVWAHKGGYGLHPAYRCQGGCQGPLVRDVVAQRWMAGRYDRHWHHGLDIVPMEELAA